ncbi:MAG: putative zinc-binding protein [Desulfoprunum sp.]
MVTIPSSCSCGCNGSSGPRVIFSCSGAADVGELADRAARRLTRKGTGKMFCLAGISGKVSGIIASTKVATKILAIDGCALDCTKKSLVEAGITRINHLRLTDLGFEKGKTDITADTITQVVDKAYNFI